MSEELTAKEKLELFRKKQLEQQKRYQKRIYRGWAGVIIGIILFFIPTMFSMYTKSKQKPAQVAYEKKVDYFLKEKELANAYNKWVVKRQAGSSEKAPDISKLTGKDNKTPIGMMTIPSIHLDNMPVYHGDTEWVLNHGLGNIEWTSLPTGGIDTTSTITGHTGLANSVFFDNIRYLKKGDMVYLNSLGEKKTYEVTGETKVIDPFKEGADKNFFLQPGEDTLILMTCTPIYINTHRLLVFAKRVPEKVAAKKKVVIRDRFSLYNVWMYVMLFLILLLLLLLWYQKRRRDRKIAEIEEELQQLIAQEEEEEK